MPTPAADDEHRAAVTPSTFPLRYFVFAHLSLAASVGAIALFPQSFAGFFYHPRMLAAVHLVTLGWITSHILGALYLIAPMALRTRLRTTRADRIAFWLYTIGVLGMVGHFWIGEMGGMVSAAPLVLGPILLVGVRTLSALRRSPIEGAVKLHYWLAFANMMLAGSLGMLLGWHRLDPFLDGEPLGNLFAHVHLAALGWATMTVFGSAQRLLPMLLPSTPPPAAMGWTSAALLEVGALGLAWSSLDGGRRVALFAGVAAVSVAWFLGLVVWMLLHRRRPGPGLPRIDATRIYALQAVLYLAIATAIGCTLAFVPRSEESLRLAKVYGACGLLGFMGSMILGVAGRHVPVLFWSRTLRETGTPPPFSPYRLRPAPLQALELVTWSAGVPLLAFALWREAPSTLRVAATLLLIAVATSGVNHVESWRRARIDEDDGPPATTSSRVTARRATCRSTSDA